MNEPTPSTLLGIVAISKNDSNLKELKRSSANMKQHGGKQALCSFMVLMFFDQK